MLGSLLLAVGVLLGGPATAHADGLPLPVDDAGRSGVIAPGGDERYVALGAAESTVVAAVRPGGEVIRSRSLRGDFTIPAVASDGTADGLSADGETLALIRPRSTFPRRRTAFAVLDTERLRLRHTVTLEGDFSFDAISPDGSRLYLIEYLSRTDPTRYAVRAYDVERGRLVPDPIEDPSEPASEMGGYPVTRAFSPDGRWAYTLYDGSGGGHPFVHALDTQMGRAVCVDLHDLDERGNVYRSGLDVSPDGGVLTVTHRDTPVALIDTKSFEVGDPPAEPGEANSGGVPWALLVPGAAILVLAAAALRLRRRSVRARRSAPVSDAELAEMVGIAPAQAEADADGARLAGETSVPANGNGSSAGPVRR